VKIENFEKKIHGRVKILGWSRKHGTLSGAIMKKNSSPPRPNGQFQGFSVIE
jgi:hypothetical protein